MNGNRITCATCHSAWTVSITPSIYAQQAIESCPCSHCGAYTLRCSSAADSEPLNPRRRKRAFPDANRHPQPQFSA
jgi:hypothetical protein